MKYKKRRRKLSPQTIQTMPNQTAPSFTQLPDLASERLGGRVLYANDDFFAPKENLIKEGRGIFIPDKYTDRGKWMDGWESRRKREPGHDCCVLQLAVAGTIEGLDIDTNHFLGNHPPFASVDAIYLPKEPSLIDIRSENLSWSNLLSKSPLNPGSQHFFTIQSQKIWTHLRLNIFPDGGIARFKVYGQPFKNWDEVAPDELVDLASVLNGGKTLQCNDMFFSKMQNLIIPGKGKNMGDGWETKRNRTPNNRDWVILQLAKKGMIEKIVVDTAHFKGNYPDSCSLEGCLITANEDIANPQLNWKPILSQVKLQADTEHWFDAESTESFTHVRFNIFPDGGVSRLRLFGKLN